MTRKLILCMTFAAMFLIGCGNGDRVAVQPKDVVSEARVAKIPVNKATTGIIRGVVRLAGTPPRMSVINMRREPNCAAVHSSPPASEEVLAGADGALQNVVVYLRGDFSAYSFPEPSSPVTIDQKGCIYVPRVVGLTTKTTLRVLNSDSLTHNVNANAENNRRWNKTQTIGAAPIEDIFFRPEISVVLRCNLHPWMKTYLAVFDHPYFQVTGSDGSFSLGNVPPGTYDVTAWHERYGTKEQTITLGVGEKEEIALSFKEGRG